MRLNDNVLPYEKRLGSIGERVDALTGSEHLWPALRKVASGRAYPRIGLMDKRASSIDINTSTKSYRWVITDEGRVYLWVYPDREQKQDTGKLVAKGDLWNSNIDWTEMKFEMITDDGAWYKLEIDIDEHTGAIKRAPAPKPAAKAPKKSEARICQ